MAAKDKKQLEELARKRMEESPLSKIYKKMEEHIDKRIKEFEAENASD